MKDNVELLTIVQTALGTFDHRQSFSPGMFEPLEPLFRRLGYASVAIYIADDYPDRMRLVSGYGGEAWFPPHVVLRDCRSLHDELSLALRDVPDIMLAPLFSHDRELGVVAATMSGAVSSGAREAFRILAKTLSIMAYVERIRTNARREREERDIFFAQSLTNRILPRTAPKVKGMRLGCEHVRSLDAGGDFFDFLPRRDGSLFGIIGCCNSKGLRTAQEVCSILRVIHRAERDMENLSEMLRLVNDYLVRERRRAYQASLCLFHADVSCRRLRLAKAGRLGILLCGAGTGVTDVSATGSAFLGMVAKPEVRDEEYDFAPGQSLFCVTEGLYSCQNLVDAEEQAIWFHGLVKATLAARPRLPLANAIFDAIRYAVDATRSTESMLAVSVEAGARSQNSVRLSVARGS